VFAPWDRSCVTVMLMSVGGKQGLSLEKDSSEGSRQCEVRLAGDESFGGDDGSRGGRGGRGLGGAVPARSPVHSKIVGVEAWMSVERWLETGKQERTW